MQNGARGSENDNADGVSKAEWRARLANRIQVQRYNVSVLEATYHVVKNFAQHSGPIVFATKLFTGHKLGFYTHLERPAHGETTP